VRTQGADAAPSSPPPTRARLSRRSFAFDSLFTASAGVLAYSLALITGPLLARNLGAAGRGELAAVSVPADLFSWILCFGLPVAAVYFAKEHDRRHLVMSSWVFSLVAGGLFVAAVWFLIPSYLSGHSPLTVPWLRAFLVVNLAFAPVITAIELLTAEGAMVAFNLWFRLPLVINTIAVVVLAILGRLTLTTALAASLGSNVIWFASVILALRAWPGRGFRLHVMKRQLRYGSKQVLGLVSNLVIQRLDQFLLVGLVSPAKLGVYAVAATASSVTGPLAEGIGTTLFPRLLHISADRHRAMLGRAMILGFVASILASAAVAAAVPWFIPTLFGNAFRASVLLVWVLLPGQCAANVATIAAAKLLADGRPGAQSSGLFWAALTTVIGLFLFVGSFGILAAAVVTSVSQFVFLAYVMIAVRRGPPLKRIHWVAPA
jgi:O-antigen/teichoic acid export membrane protein